MKNVIKKERKDNVKKNSSKDRKITKKQIKKDESSSDDSSDKDEKISKREMRKNESSSDESSSDLSDENNNNEIVNEEENSSDESSDEDEKKIAHKGKDSHSNFNGKNKKIAKKQIKKGDSASDDSSDDTSVEDSKNIVKETKTTVKNLFSKDKKMGENKLMKDESSSDDSSSDSSSENDEKSDSDDSSRDSSDKNTKKVALKDKNVSDEESAEKGSHDEGEESSSSIEMQSSSIDEENKEDVDTRVVFIRGIPYSLGEDELKKEMKSIGRVVRVSIPITGDKDRNKGFCFVEFLKENDAKKCLKLDGQELFGRKLVVNMANNGDRKKKYTIKITNLPYVCDKEEFSKYISKFGEHGNLVIPTDKKTGRGSGICYVAYENEELFKKMLKKNLKFKDRTLYVKDANEVNKDKYNIRKRSFDQDKGNKKNDRSENKRGKFSKDGYKGNNKFDKNKGSGHRDKEINSKKNRVTFEDSSSE